MQVPTISIVFLIVSILGSIAIPVCLFFIFWKRYQAPPIAFLIGVLTFLLFAMVLEGICNSLILNSSFGLSLSLRPVWYSLFGGLMAGLFEETGRYLSFRTVLKKHLPQKQTALMYGAGHSGIEIAILLVSVCANLILMIQIQTGNASPDAAAQALCSTAPSLFLAVLIERISAAVLHLSLSVFVFRAATGRFYWYLIAIVLHALTDASALLLSLSGIHIWVIESIIGIQAVIIAYFAFRIFRRMPSES